jgi:hypothetical protein
VYSGVAEELTPWAYIFDRFEEDGSEADQERLRTQLITDRVGIRIVDRLYEDDNDLPPADAAAAPIAHITESRVREALNAGPHFVSLSGHGSWDGCCYLSRDMADKLSSDPLFIGYADSCLTSQFDRGNQYNTGADPCSAHLLTNSHGGAVAYIGNSRYSFIGYGAIYQRLFFHQLTATHHLGEVFDILRTILHTIPGAEVYSRWAMFALNLMGDPEMPLWLPTPAVLHVQAPEQLAPEWVSPAAPLEVTVTQQLGDPVGPATVVEGAAVSLRQGDVTQLALTNAQGVATFNLEGAAPGPMEITASQFGAVPTQRVIQVVAKPNQRVSPLRRILLMLVLLLLLIGFALLLVFLMHRSA